MCSKKIVGPKAKFSFSKDTKRRLAATLRVHGCRTVTPETLDGFEFPARKYYRHALSGAERPAFFSAVEALAILGPVQSAERALDDSSPEMRRRLARIVVGKKFDLDDYAMTDLVECCIDTYNRTFQQAGRDKQLSRLSGQIAKHWKSSTGSSFPALPSWNQLFFKWEDVRDLQQHPLWIVMEALGVRMCISSTEKLAQLAVDD